MISHTYDYLGRIVSCFGFTANDLDVIGTTVSHYKILEKLGEGGMGVVYKAQDTRLDRTVALKFLPQYLTGNEAEETRFLREARAASALNHPNVCGIHAIGDHDGQIFIDMEYVEGATLKRVVPIDRLDDVLQYAVQIADALREAHKYGIVHRDIKCENIMVNATGKIKVMDFGLAKLKGSLRLTKTAAAVGTTAYMSPEQIQGEEVDYRSDQFSFGVVLFEMLTGRRPFRGEHEVAMMYSIVNEEPSSASTSRSGIPEGLLRIITKLLSKEPLKRYARTDELVNELREVESSGSNRMMPQNSQVANTTPTRMSKRSWIVGSAGVLLLLGGAYMYFAPHQGSNERIESIAVLPFRNVSGDPNIEYLSDGITEHIINALSRLRKMRVIPRSTSFHYKGKDGDARAVGEELNVSAVLTGRVIMRGDDLNIQVELIDVREQSQLWGEQYVRKTSDLLNVQEDIERSIAGQLHLTGDETRTLTKRTAVNTDAYQLYLRGRYYWDKRTVAGFGKALQYFQQALDLDPTYALAQTGEADCYDLLGLGVYSGLSPAEAYPKAKAALEKAFQFDSTIGEAYATRAHMNHSFEWDWPRVERDFHRAIELSPKYGTAHAFYGVYLNAMGRNQEAMDQFVLAQQLEPLSLPINTWLGIKFYYDRNYDKAIEQISKAIDIDPGFANGHYFIGWPYLAKGLTREAIHEFQLGRSYSDNNPVMLSGLVYALYHDGQRAYARALLDTLVQMSTNRYVSPHNLAIAYAGVGDTLRFYEYLEKSVNDHAFIVTVGVMRYDPFFDFAQHDPRFIALVKRTGLPLR